MKTILIILYTGVIILLSGLPHESAITAQTKDIVEGIVFHDINLNGSYDPQSDKPLKGIAVSNSRDVVITDNNGFYSLQPIDNSAIFVIKPRGWRTLINENQTHNFFYLYSITGATGKEYEGLAPTKPLPESVNFPLYPNKEPNNLNVLVFGDTQPRDDKEIYYMAQDVLPELVNVDVSFGITLGDVVFDRLSLFNHLAGSISTLGAPWWYILGNHDIDYSGENNKHARGAWYRAFGPSWYSFSYGPAHFIVLDDVRRVNADGRNTYRTGLGKDQMKFLRNEIERLDPDQFLVLLAHIPYEGSTEWESKEEKEAFYKLLASHPKSFTLVAHTHRHYHHFIDNSHGYPGENPHHMVSVGTVCGAWWSGAPNEYGIPHTMMSDGTPNGYAFLYLNNNDWKLKWKSAGKPESYQMHIDAPDVINSDSTYIFNVTANIYNALPTAEVKMRIGNKEDWITMKRNRQEDPYRLAAMEKEQQLGSFPWRKLGRATTSEHIWIATSKVKLKPGEYVIEVQAHDEWWSYEGKKLLRVK